MRKYGYKNVVKPDVRGVLREGHGGDDELHCELHPGGRGYERVHNHADQAKV